MTGNAHYQWLHDALAARSTVITSSRRLARELLAAYAEQQVACGRTVWPSADIFFWQDWLQHGLDGLTDEFDSHLIDTPSTVLLWEQCLGKLAGEELLSTAGLVRDARRAWQRSQEWLVSPAQLAKSAASRDEHWFARAATSYQARLDDAQWIDGAQLAARCTELVANGHLVFNTSFVYAGFDRLTPAMSALFERLREQGCAVEAAPAPQNDTTCQLRTYADAAAMWRAAGHWARQRLEREPGARVAIILPDLDTDAAGISRTVREGFAPGWQQAGERYRNAVDVSYGMPLSMYPVIAVAGLCLRFAAEGLSSTDISTLIRSPFIGGDELDGRCRFDLTLRGLPDRQWQPDTLLAALPQQENTKTGAGFHASLAELAALHRRRNDRQSPAEWAKTFDEVLKNIGWPGYTEPDSAEFQLRNRWRQLLNELAQLGSVGKRMNLAESVGRLFQIADDTVYQPESQDGGLRVLGMLEAIGLEFDYLWLGAMDASRWPAAGRPLALVNRQLQRDLGMPDASPADTLQFSQRTLQRILRAARFAEISWARLEDDKELIPSPLLDVKPADVTTDAGDPQWHATSQLAAQSTGIPDDNAPPVRPGERISGGAYTVQAMREEPFQAFCQGRLHVRELDLLLPGLTARMRGVVVHGALHHLLRELPALSEIRNWDDAERSERIDKAAWWPLAPHWSQADPVLRRLLQLEKRRLSSLLEAFLRCECERDNFEIVGVETKAEFKDGPVALRLRIDRLDRLDDGALLITDYKASDAKPFLDTKRGTPKQLQLSVYARALQDDSVGGLQLTYLNSREIKYVGEGGSIRIGKADIDNWSGLLEGWCAEVDVLVKRFAAGDTGLNAVQEIKKARPLALLSRFAELSNAG